jgi:23S rRNA (cytidine2498-2'-O)-methyltransferase
MPSTLIRIPAIFQPVAPEVLAALGQPKAKKLGADYFLANSLTLEALDDSPASPFVSWVLPLGHVWPCHPSDIDGFIEKAAQALVKKFAETKPQALLVGSLAGAQENSYYKSLASNLRGRLLQIFPSMTVGQPEDQNPAKNTLFVMVGREGLYAGVAQPRATRGFYPGGTKFMKQTGPQTISRAGAKIAEALHQLQLFEKLPKKGSHWLELGASPGGMTSELLARDYLVTAVDRAPLHESLDDHPRLHFIKYNVADYESHHPEPFDALLCDMNGDAHLSFNQVLRLLPALAPKALIIFTLKTPTTESYTDLVELNQAILKRASLHGVKLICHTHLTYNRREFTLMLRRS